MFGRLWCGWACPQTIFMEMIFRKIEYLIEGNYIQQKTLNSSTLSPEKFIKKTLKHIIFFSLSFLIANTFLAYIIGIDELTTIITDNPLNHKAGLISIFVFTGVFYAVYARFREQACIVVCPYGRLQGVLLDSNSVVIGYDYKRGEPRAKLRKNEERSAGDCIDCHQCVQVCPTGIDIRNGTQLECINCTACIDACNTIMGRIKKPLGLIRYTSENSISKREKFKITPRIIAYSAILFILLAALSVLFASRESLETTILRTPGLLYQEVNNDQISNLYNIKIVNKTFNNMNIQLRLDSPEGEIKWVGNPVEIIKSESIAAGVFFIIISKSEIQKVKTPVNISIISDGKIINRVKTSIMGPNI
jgi:cytochrome c oxidase accessory protein FixG